MFVVEHFIKLDETGPEQVVEVYGPFLYRQTAAQYSYGVKAAEYGPIFDWDARGWIFDWDARVADADKYPDLVPD